MFETERHVIDEIARLRKGYRRRGNWTLAQICWHVSLPIEKHLAPPQPMDLAPTAEQAKLKAAFVDYIVVNKQPPPHAKDAPPPYVPPTTANDADIDRYLAQLGRMATFPHPKVMMGPVGPVTIAEFRACNVLHAAHHLGFLEPTAAARREGLRYTDEDAIAADVQALRHGYTQSGLWSLPQVCWHLEQTIMARMQPGPFPQDTPEQTARRGVMDQALATGRLPDGVKAPDAVVPAPELQDDAIDSFLATLRRFRDYTGPIHPHRLFGHLTNGEAHKLNLVHCAHHLSHLTPLATGN